MPIVMVGMRAAKVSPAVLYLRMAPQLHRALATRAAESGVSLDAWAVGGAEQSTRPDSQGMKAITNEFRNYWYERLGFDEIARVDRMARDDDRVWAWWVGHRPELQALTAMGLVR